MLYLSQFYVFGCDTLNEYTHFNPLNWKWTWYVVYCSQIINNHILYLAFLCHSFYFNSWISCYIMQERWIYFKIIFTKIHWYHSNYTMFKWYTFDDPLYFSDICILSLYYYYPQCHLILAMSLLPIQCQRFYILFTDTRKNI